MKIKFVKTLSIATLLAVTSISTPVSAASQCKGLDSKACNASAACGWVNGYQRKDGRTVKAFCRTTSKGASNAQSSKAKSLVKKTTNKKV